MAARLPLLDPAKAKDLASVFFDNAQFDTVDPQPSYMPNFDAANPQAPPKETTQYGISTFDTATPERQDTQVERAAARWRLANLPANYQYHPEDLAGNAPLSQEKADRSLLGDTVLAHTGEPALASLASLFDPLSPSDPLDTGIPGINPGKIAPAIFLGIGARTADKKAYKLANEMEKAGRHPEVIRQMTGWQRAADGNWKFEISDKNAKLTGVQRGDLKDVFDHPELYAAHPRIGETRVTFGANGGSYYQPAREGAIKTLPVINIGKGAKDPLAAMIHEASHDVQHRSGFAPGANTYTDNLKPSHPAWDIYQQKLADLNDKKTRLSFFRSNPTSPEVVDAQLRQAAMDEYYARSAGENEANAAMYRRGLSPEELRTIPPQAHMNYPPDQQIVEPPRVPGNKAPEPQLQDVFAGRRAKPGDKGVLINGKLYTDPGEHVVALEKAAQAHGFSSLEEAANKQPDLWNSLDENNFGEIGADGKFVPDAVSHISHAPGVGSVTYDDWQASRVGLDDFEDPSSQLQVPAPKMGEDDFNKMIADIQAKNKAVEDAVHAAIAKDGIYVSRGENGRALTVTPSMAEPGLFQITYWDKGQPTGHFNSRPVDLGRETRSMGGDYQPVTGPDAEAALSDLASVFQPPNQGK